LDRDEALVGASIILEKPPMALVMPDLKLLRIFIFV